MLSDFTNINSIFKKLIFSYLTIGILSIVIVSIIFFISFKNALLERTFKQLSSINQFKKLQIERFIQEEDIINYSDTLFIKKVELFLMERTGLDQTGESYLVDEKGKLLTKSRFITDNQLIKINDDNLKDIIQNKEGNGIFLDYRGIQVLSYYRSITIGNSTIILLTEIDEHEALLAIQRIQKYIFSLLVFIALIIVWITFFLANKIVSPILSVKNMIDDLAIGKIPEKTIDHNYRDEIGAMITSLNQLVNALKETNHFAIEIGKGNFNVQYQPIGADDILGNTLLDMRDQIIALQEKKLNIQREKTSALLEGQEKERQRIARELHDGIGQLLTGIHFKLESIALPENDKKELKLILNETIKEVKRISYSSMPSALNDFGLKAALQALCKNVSQMGNFHLEFDFVVQQEDKLNFEVSTTIYRIIQEGLNNCLKYAKASKVLVEIFEEGNKIFVELSDNGIGFDVEKNKTLGHGLANMEKRATIIGGKSTISSIPGKGTKIIIELPIKTK